MNCLRPQTIEEFAAALAQCTAESAILAGGTDLIIRLRQGGTSPDLLVYPGQIPALRAITLTERELRIGALATMTEIAAALAAEPAFGALADAAAGVGSPQIRNKATIGGNLCSASPAGDLLPVCLLLEAQVEVLDADGAIRSLPVSEFIRAPHETALQPGQAVTAVVIDRERLENAVSAFYKIGAREAVSIARESAAVCVTLGADGAVRDARVTLGAVANTPIRVPAAEALLCERGLTDGTTDALWPILSQTIHDNCRPTNRAYKTAAAHGLTADLLARLRERAEK